MDLIRGAAVLAVIAWHAFAVPTDYGVRMPEWVHDVFEATSPVRLPVLFLLSGMLLPAAVRKGPAEYLEGKLRHVVWPFAVWVVITVAAAGDLEVLKIGKTWRDGPHHLWFMVVLGTCLIAGYLCRWVSPWVLTVGLLILSSVWEPSSDTAVRFLQYGVYFFAGAALWPLLERLGATGWTWRWEPLEAVGRASIIWYSAHYAPMLLVCRAAAEHVDPPVLYALTLLVGYGVPALLVRGRHLWPWLFRAPDMLRLTPAPAAVRS